MAECVPELVFVQSMKETGWLQYGGDVEVDPNFAGIGAVGRRRCREPTSRTCAPASEPRFGTCAPTRTRPHGLPGRGSRFSYVRKGAAPVVGTWVSRETRNPHRLGDAPAGTDLVPMLNAYFEKLRALQYGPGSSRCSAVEPASVGSGV